MVQRTASLFSAVSASKPAGMGWADEPRAMSSIGSIVREERKDNDFRRCGFI